MDRKDKLTIERWELKDVIDVFRMLVNTYRRLRNGRAVLTDKSCWHTTGSCISTTERSLTIRNSVSIISGANKFPS